MKTFIACLLICLAFGNTSFAQDSSQSQIDQDRNDIRIVKIEITDKTLSFGPFTDYRLDPDQCFMSDFKGPQSQWINCTKPFNDLGLGPTFVNIDVENRPDLRCQILEVTTASRKTAFDKAKSVGFYYSGHGRSSGASLSTADLASFSTIVRLKNGEEAVLNKFFGVAGCWNGSIVASINQPYYIKPYLEFADESRNMVWRNWDFYPYKELGQANYMVSLQNKIVDFTTQVLDASSL
jgi:hypothetical protein